MDVEALSRETGWRIEHREVSGSTNDDARALRAAGAGARTAVVADAQTAGRGREGRSFLSPVGGLYVSLLVEAPPSVRPAGVVALAAVAVCEAIESLPGDRPAPAIKWPNDVWLDRRKVAGILVEAAERDPLVVVGIGVNVGFVPAELEPPVRRRTAALGDGALRTPLLREVLSRVDARRSALIAGDLVGLEAAWRRRLALMGEAVAFTWRGERRRGVLEEASLAQGLLVRDSLAGPVWRDAALVQDLAAADD